MLRADSTNRLMIGSGASQYTQDIYYDYVYWTTEGAFPPTNLWPAVYSGNGQSGTITALDVPFNQSSSTLNKIRFSIGDTGGHIWQSPVYNVSTSGPVTVWADFDHDGDVDQNDFAHLQNCFSGSGLAYGPACANADVNGDGDVDSSDINAFLPCMAGADQPPGC
jgi:hypothetical protein